MDYDFYINFKDPFELKLFLEPNKVSWEIRNEDLKFNFFESKIFYLMNNFTINPISLIENCSYKTIIVYCNVDYLKTIYNDKKQEDLNEIWRLNYNELFIESDFLINQINELPTKKGIVFHTRFTSLMGDFKDTVSVVLDENARKELLLELVEKIQEKSIFNPTKKIYVVSDSILFLNYIKENTSFNVLPGIPKHIDLNDFEKDLTPHLKTFTDFYFMVKSEKVYLLKLGQMYSSNFSRYAAILGKVSFSILKK
ncbi:hypothetical protein [Flavobacterium aquidurense]|uniref:hypothetical protein n=1 Tax=Flavobacterium aquidurense TaxID=362413 RepID=UPI00285FDD51|nr:hypothetical protein [Flavobacterium aquidurense]MDR7372313.1 hypothetical protein [Flavobacterium aquidurense]